MSWVLDIFWQIVPCPNSSISDGSFCNGFVKSGNIKRISFGQSGFIGVYFRGLSKMALQTARYSLFCKAKCIILLTFSVKTSF